MQNLKKYTSRAFVISSFYLLAVILGGFFILPGIFNIENYDFPIFIELFLKVTSVLAVTIVIFSAVTIPLLYFARKQKRMHINPTLVAATVLLAGFVFIFLNGLYVRLRTCSPEDYDVAWHCQVEGKSYVGMIIVVFFLASLVGSIAWIIQRLMRKK